MTKSNNKDTKERSHSSMETGMSLEDILTQENIYHVWEEMNSGFVLLDNDLRYLYLNSHAEKMMGVTKGQILGKRMPDVFAKFKDSPFYKSGMQAFTQKKTQEIEQFSAIQQKWLNVRSIPMKNGMVFILNDITDRKKDAENIRQSEERYKNYIETSSQAIWRFELSVPISINLPVHKQIDKIFEYAYLAEGNTILARMYGYENINEIIGKNVKEFLPPIKENIEYLKRFITNHYRLDHAESKEVDKDGNTKYFLNNLIGIVKDGYLIRAWGSQQDITAEKERQYVINMRLKLQEAVAELGQKALQRYPLDNLISDAAQQLSEILQVEYTKITELLPDGKKLLLRGGVGWKSHVIINKTLIGIGRDSQAGYTLMSKKPVIVKDLTTDKRFKGPSLLKSHGVVSGMSVILYNNDGPYGVLGVHSKKKRIFTQEDVQYLQSVANVLSFAIQQHETLESIKNSEENFRTVIETIPQIVFVTDPDGCQEFYNKRWYEYTRASPDKTIGDQWSANVHPEDRQKAVSLWKKSIKTGDANEVEYRLKNGTTGEYRWFLERALPIRDKYGKIYRWFGTCTDIHGQKMVQEALERSKAQFQSLYDSNIIGVLYCDLDGNIFEANDVFLSMIGYDRVDLEEGRICWDELTAPEYTEYDNKAIKDLLKCGVAKPWEKELICKDGSQTPVIMGMTMLDKEKKECVGFVLDITERKKLEQRKDEFIGIASHELKTPLTSIKGYVQILERIITEMGNDKAKLYLSRTNTYINRLNSLIADLLDVSKIQAGKLQMDYSSFNFDDLVKESIESVQHTSSRHSIIKRGRVNTQIQGDRHRLEQVFTNLLSNAIKYSPNAEKVVVNVERENGSIIVSVQDYGVGISEQEQSKLFNRFYRVESTSKKFSGLGIGLYISSQIISRHGGRMWVKSKEGEGSTFYFSIPVISSLFIH